MSVPANPNGPIDFNEKAIESEVFRFVSVRSPQRITKTEHKRIAAPYDTGAASDFYDDLVAAIADPANDTDDVKLEACKSLAGAYKESDGWLGTIGDLEALNTSIVGLYDWMQVNIATFTVATFGAKVTGLEIDATMRGRVWDNLFARMILGGDGALRTALMETIVIDFLLTNYLDEELVTGIGDLRQMVNARVILPEAIFPLPATNTAIPTFTPPEDTSEEDRAALLASFVAYKTALEELQDALDVLIEAREMALPVIPVIEVSDETERTTPYEILTTEILATFTEGTADILEAHNLIAGTRFTFCNKVLEKKLAKLSDELFTGAEFGRRVIVTGGAIWEAPVGKRSSYDVCLPPENSADAYEDFYKDDGKCRIKPLGIGDLLRIEQKLCCYAPGEVAHIENILQGEYKERATRRLHRTEDTFISITDKQTTNERDTITTEQFEMQKAASTVTQQDQSFNVGLTASYLGPVQVSVNSNFSMSTSTNTANSVATNYAKSVTDRALQRIVESTHEERIRKVIDEYEETNTHGLDNRRGTAHVVGLYRWTDKIYEAQVVNYGKRLMFEFMIPEPAAFHLWAMAKPGSATTYDLVEPIDPRSAAVIPLGLQPLDQWRIQSYDYHRWSQIFGVTLDPAPAPKVVVSFSVHEEELTTTSARHYDSFVVPDNYEAYLATASMVIPFAATAGCILQIGKSQAFFHNMPSVWTYNMDKETGKIPIGVAAVIDLTYFTLNVTLECNLRPEAMRKWQRDCYDKIMEAYFQKKAAYDQALAEAKAGYGNGIFGTNPAINRQIERNELKKGCLNALYYGGDFSSDSLYFTADFDACNPPKTLTDCCAIAEGERAKFLEQVFDWDFMSYIFYPYFHAQKCRWQKLYQLQDADTEFLKFLQSGMARVVVPVRQGFEEVAMYFLRTGQIWGGGPVPGINSNLYISIVNELYPGEDGTKPWKSAPWEIRVPTTLTVLQCKSGCTSGEGLPCDCGAAIATGVSKMEAGDDDPVLPGTRG